jgi:hypothetical protein
MKSGSSSLRPIFLLLFVATGAAPIARAWDYYGHRLVNQLALASLPEDFPAFVREPANVERIGFLAGEPDRWRNTVDLPFKHAIEPDHQIDLESLDELDLKADTLTEFRQVFATQQALARAQHPERFRPIDPTRNTAHTRETIGFLPWTITEYYGKLRSAFAYLRVFQDLGTPEEIANARANVVYIMGIMGHYVGDGAQPLHTTKYYNGWFGDNPHGYTTTRPFKEGQPTFHSWIDSGFIDKAGIKRTDLEPRMKAAQALALTPRADGRDPMFAQVMDYLLATHAQVEPLYELEKAGKFKADGSPGSTDGRPFIEERLLQGSQMLAAIWMTAWRNPMQDNFLRSVLAVRQGPAKPAPKDP